MEIKLQEVIPAYFEKQAASGSQVWGKNISFKPGDHVHIVAPSGSGKTSLMHFIYGMRKDYNGIISYNDKSIGNFDMEDFSSYRQKNISIVFQDMRLFPTLTARENIEVKRILNPFHPSEKIEEMASRLGISTKLSRKVSTCSYGEQQRIAIIRSLMQPFEFLLLDEPFSHLDENNRMKAMELIKEECAARKASMIFADLKKLDYLNEATIINL